MIETTATGGNSHEILGYIGLAGTFLTAFFLFLQNLDNNKTKLKIIKIQSEADNTKERVVEIEEDNKDLHKKLKESKKKEESLTLRIIDLEKKLKEGKVKGMQKEKEWLEEKKILVGEINTLRKTLSETQKLVHQYQTKIK